MSTLHKTHYSVEKCGKTHKKTMEKCGKNLQNPANFVNKTRPISWILYQQPLHSGRVISIHFTSGRFIISFSLLGENDTSYLCFYLRFLPPPHPDIEPPFSKLSPKYKSRQSCQYRYRFLECHCLRSYTEYRQYRQWK